MKNPLQPVSHLHRQLSMRGTLPKPTEAASLIRLSWADKGIAIHTRGLSFSHRRQAVPCAQMMVRTGGLTWFQGTEWHLCKHLRPGEFSWPPLPA